MTGMILIDLQKVFSTIDHDILLKKLYAIGFSKHSVNWFRSYLISRTFLVNLGNKFSQPACLYSGTTQESIIGPKHSMICHKTSNIIFSFTLMIHTLYVNIKILMKLKKTK